MRAELGSRERAERSGATLEFWSENGVGTEIELTVPAAIAYGTSRESIAMKLWRKVSPRNRAKPS